MKKDLLAYVRSVSDDWMIYSSEMYAEWIFKQRKVLSTCCVYAMCTSALVNACEQFLRLMILCLM